MAQPIYDIASPCVRNCCLNDSDICLGCGRSLHEITQWGASNNSEKRSIIVTAAERRQIMCESKKIPPVS